jgi:hypothetical protein
MHLKTPVIYKCLTLSLSHEENKPTDTTDKIFQIPYKDTALHASNKDFNKLSTDKLIMFHNKLLVTSGLMAGFKKCVKAKYHQKYWHKVVMCDGVEKIKLVQDKVKMVDYCKHRNEHFTTT